MKGEGGESSSVVHCRERKQSCRLDITDSNVEPLSGSERDGQDQEGGCQRDSAKTKMSRGSFLASVHAGCKFPDI